MSNVNRVLDEVKVFLNQENTFQETNPDTDYPEMAGSVGDKNYLDRLQASAQAWVSMLDHEPPAQGWRAKEIGIAQREALDLATYRPSEVTLYGAVQLGRIKKALEIHLGIWQPE